MYRTCLLRQDKTDGCMECVAWDTRQIHLYLCIRSRSETHSGRVPSVKAPKKWAWAPSLQRLGLLGVRPFLLQTLPKSESLSFLPSFIRRPLLGPFSSLFYYFISNSLCFSSHLCHHHHHHHHHKQLHLLLPSKDLLLNQSIEQLIPNPPNPPLKTAKFSCPTVLFFCSFITSMDCLQIDWDNIDHTFVRDEFYENIQAPKWIDFNAPFQPIDDFEWFCAKSG